MQAIHRTIVFDVSSHGLGHLGQVGPVVLALRERCPACRIVVRTEHPAHLVRDSVGRDVVLAPPPPEATMFMHGPAAVDALRSAEAYFALHAKWDEHLERETIRLAAFSPSILVSDISYLSLAVARRLGVPAIALCSLNWGDIFQAYCGKLPGTAKILGTINEAYRSADVFLQLRPHMPMQGLPNVRSIGPIARTGRNRQSELRAAVKIPHRCKIVLVSLGGIPKKDVLLLSAISGVHWLLGPGVWAPPGTASDARALDVPFIDLLASSDAVVTKVGYATFVEAACNGTALISAPRDDWPESQCLCAWAEQNANFALSPEFEGQGISRALEVVLGRLPKPAVPATGIAQACHVIADMGGT